MPVCFNKRCRKEKNQISNLFFPIYDNEKKIKNESNGMKERELGGTKTASQLDAVWSGCTEQLL